MATQNPNLDSTELSPNQKVLLFSAFANLNAAQRQRLQNGCAQVTDWSSLLQQAEFRLIVPQLHHHIKHGGPDGNQIESVPTDVLEILRVKTIAVAAKNLQFAQLQKTLVNDVLEPLGVPYLFVKGISLSERYYPQGMCRSMRDIDLFIPRRAMVPVAQSLRRLSFRSDLGEVFHTEAGQRFQQQFCGMTNWVSPDGLLVEIKSEFDPNWQRFDVNSLIAEAEEVVSFGQTIRVMPTTQLMVYLAYHHLWHHCARLHWLVDFDAITKHESCHVAEIMDVARKTGLTRMVAAMLEVHRLHAQGATAMSQCHSDDYAHHLYWLMLQNVKGDRSTERALRRSVLTRSADLNRWQRLWDRIVRKNLRRFYPVADDYAHLPLPPPWQKLYYILRPFLWLLRR
jgi:hypothetical protein